MRTTRTRPERTPRRTAAALAAAAVLLAGCSAGSGTSGTGTSGTGTTSGAARPLAASGQSLQRNYTAVVKRVLPSVVQIETGAGLGSGVVFDAHGRVVTNAHVVGTATSFVVRTSGSSGTLSATLVATYPADDLAVIQVKGATDLRPATFADSRRVLVGDIVLAMGSPLGLSGSVTDGIVSAVGRTVTEPATSDSPGATLPDVIQTSAAINPGNSGGALVDLAGRVVGIPTLAAVDQQIGGTAPGIGFAIPSRIVTDIAGQIVDHGRVVNSHRAALGVSVVTVAAPDGSPAGAGVATVTSGGGADKAGVQAGDVITAVNGTTVSSTADLSAVLAQLSPGDTVTVTYQRGGNEHTAKVALGQPPAG